MKRYVCVMMIAALLFAGCRKKEDPTANNKVGIMNEMVRYIDSTRVEISGTYSYLTSLDAIYVLVGTSNDMSDAMAFESVLSGKSFTADVTGLKENTNYYYRYRFVSMGTEQEQEPETVKSFTTGYSVPAVTTAEVSEITGFSAKCGGEVTEDYGFSVTARGVCWSTSPDPTVSDSHTTDGSGTGSFTSSITGLTDSTTYYVRAYATNGAGTSYGEQKSFTTTYVDLDLPSGLLWATRNVGADSPEDYGGYFAWGETETKSTYNWSTYKWCNGSYRTLTKYCTQSIYGTVDNKTVLDLEDDAAHANWGGGWRMPTTEEWQELYDNTTCTWTTENGVYGCKFTSKADSSKYIFLPAAGSREGAVVEYAGSLGYYWSSSLNSSSPYNVPIMLFGSGGVGQSSKDRDYGSTVRPVR